MTRPSLCIIDPVKPSGQSYTAPIVTAAQSHFSSCVHIRPPLNELPALYEHADAIWIDWLTEHAVSASRLNRGLKKPLWIRLHAFEVLEGRYCREVEWENVTGLVAVCDDVLKLALEQEPRIAESTRQYVISNGIDCRRFYSLEKNDRQHLAWVGEITPKKNPFMALHLLYELRRQGGDYKLSMAGAAVSDRSLRHLLHLAKVLGLENCVSLDGHISDIAPWFRDKGAIISTSLYESFGLAIAEAAASGAVPIIFNFPNASDIWPRDWIVNSLPQAAQAVLDAHPGTARDFILKNYSLDKMVTSISKVLLNDM